MHRERASAWAAAAACDLHRDGILAGFGRLAPGGRHSHQAGRWWHEATRTEVLSVTLAKTEKQYSPSTLYREHAISRELLHLYEDFKVATASLDPQFCGAVSG